MCQLGDSEDALAGVSLDLLLLDPAQKAKVVLLYRSLMTAVTELADRAVIVEDQPWWRPRRLHLPSFLQEALGPSRVRVEAYPSCPAPLAVPDDAAARRPALEAREEQAVHVYQGSLLLADLRGLGEQHR